MGRGTMEVLMKISFITDEVTQSFDEAVRFARQNGLAGLELRRRGGHCPSTMLPG